MRVNFRSYIGDKAFYKLLLMLAVPIMVQQGITSFVNLIDNVMIGSLGTICVSAVTIDNQLIWVYNLAIFGVLSGAAIFGTQFAGAGDTAGLRETFRFKLIVSLVTAGVASAILLISGGDLLMLFLDNESNSPEEVSLTLSEALKYLRIAVIGLVPFAVVQSYAGTMRETGETVIPMVGGIISIIVNLVFNYFLIYGKAGFPALGVEGAAIATVISRFVELLFVVLFVHLKKEKYGFAKGLYKNFRVTPLLVKKILVTGSPLFVNELMWALGQMFISRNYSIRGIDVVAGVNISNTVWNFFAVMEIALGSVVTIMIGQRLGKGDSEGAIDTDKKILFVGVTSQTVVGLFLIAMAPFIPEVYNVEPEVKTIAMWCLIIAGASLPIHTIVQVVYFTIRAGGKTVITFLFDSIYTWLIPGMISFLLCRFTGINVLWVYFIVQFLDIIKIIAGVPLLKSGFWTNCLISDFEADPGE